MVTEYEIRVRADPENMDFGQIVDLYERLQENIGMEGMEVKALLAYFTAFGSLLGVQSSSLFTDTPSLRMFLIVALTQIQFVLAILVITAMSWITLH